MTRLAQIVGIGALAASLVGCGRSPETPNTANDNPNVTPPEWPALDAAPLPPIDREFEKAATPPREEKFRSVQELVSFLNQEAAEGRMEPPAVFLRNTNKVAVISLETHGEDAEFMQLHKLGFLEERFGINAALCEGMLPDRHSPAQKSILAERDRILAIGAPAGELALLQSVPDMFIERFPTNIALHGIESSNSLRKASIANIIAMGLSEIEYAARMKTKGGPDVEIGERSAPPSAIQQLLAAQDALASDSTLPRLSVSNLVVSHSPGKLMITDENAKSLADHCSRYARWHLDTLVTKRNEDIGAVLDGFLKSQQQATNHLFIRMGELHGKVGDNPILNALEQHDYTVIITK